MEGCSGDPNQSAPEAKKCDAIWERLSELGGLKGYVLALIALFAVFVYLGVVVVGILSRQNSASTKSRVMSFPK
jgi:hypothetical protein